MHNWHTFIWFLLLSLVLGIFTVFSGLIFGLAWMEFGMLFLIYFLTNIRTLHRVRVFYSDY